MIISDEGANIIGTRLALRIEVKLTSSARIASIKDGLKAGLISPNHRAYSRVFRTTKQVLGRIIGCNGLTKAN